MGSARWSRFLFPRYLQPDGGAGWVLETPGDSPATDTGMTVPGNHMADRIGRLLDDATRATPAFQSVLGAVLRVLDDVRRREKVAAGAALSLAHREAMQRLADEVADTRSGLSKLLVRPADVGAVPSLDPADSWWFALADAQHAIDSAVERLSALGASQPRGSAVRGLVGEVIRGLRSHQRLLTGEAARWIEG